MMKICQNRLQQKAKKTALSARCSTYQDKGFKKAPSDSFFTPALTQKKK
jgi:hypothetical protein